MAFLPLVTAQLGCPQQRVVRSLTMAFVAGHGPIMANKTGVLTATCVSVLDNGDLAAEYDGHRGELPSRRIRSTCSLSSYAVCLPHGGVVGFKGVSTACVQLVMSALSPQPVLAAVQSSSTCSRQVSQQCTDRILTMACSWSSHR